jgi:hypothetical protein
MSQHFTVFGGAFVHETKRGFSKQQQRGKGLALWGFVLATLLSAVTAAATVTAAAWAQGAY